MMQRVACAFTRIGRKDESHGKAHVVVEDIAAMASAASLGAFVCGAGVKG